MLHPRKYVIPITPPLQMSTPLVHALGPSHSLLVLCLPVLLLLLSLRFGPSSAGVGVAAAASLEHFCRRPIPLAGAAPSSAVSACALASSSHWSVHLGCWCCCSRLLRSGYLPTCGYLTDALSSLLPGRMLCRHGRYQPADALSRCARGFCCVLSGGCFATEASPSLLAAFASLSLVAGPAS